MKKTTIINVYKAQNAPICGDGCCHEYGLMIEKIIDGDSDDYFLQTKDDDENLKIVELLEFLFGEDNVNYSNTKIQ